MKNILILIFLLLSISLFSQYEWSDPVQLSEQGVYPDITYNYPAIAYSNDSTLHAFWVMGTQIGDDLRWYSQIEYRKSTDGGLTWSATENLTPEYTDLRIYEIKAVCDSENNVHLVYLRGFENCKVMYKKFDGSSWSDPYEIYAATLRIRLGIDRTDRLYVTWNIGGTAYFTDSDVLDQPTIWSPVKSVNSDISLSIEDFVFDESNNLYGVGTEGIVYNYRPISFKYDRMKEEWVDFKVFQSYEESSLGSAIAISSKDSLYTNTLIGNGSNNRNYIQAKFKSDSIWTAPVFINENTDWDDRQMFIDANDNLHLFENHFGINTSIIYSTNTEGVWNTQYAQEETGFSFDNFNVSFDNTDNFHLIYRKINNDMLDAAVYFQRKQIVTGIENEIVPAKISLAQNYPNPFNNSTKISFALSANAEVELMVFNSKGVLVHELVNNKMKKGRHSVTFNADMISSGIYYYSLKIDGMKKATKKMLYLR